MKAESAYDVVAYVAGDDLMESVAAVGFDDVEQATVGARVM